MLAPSFCSLLLVPFFSFEWYNEKGDFMPQQNRYIIDGKRVSADEYNKSRYEDLRVRVPIGRKEEIRLHAQMRNESINGFVSRAITEALARDIASGQ